MVYVEWFPGVYRGITLVDGHPGTKGPKFSLSEVASSAAIGHMGSGLIN
jgi:hypothetical protein